MSGSVFVLSHSSDDDGAIIGIYSEREDAELARQAIEALRVAHDNEPRRRRSRYRHGDEFVIEEYVLNKTGVDMVVRVRADGKVVEKHIRLGYRTVTSNYEPRFEGVGATFEEAAQKAREEAKNGKR